MDCALGSRDSGPFLVPSSEELLASDLGGDRAPGLTAGAVESHFRCVHAFFKQGVGHGLWSTACLGWRDPPRTDDKKRRGGGLG
jgi:hypothetical protein